MITLVSRIHATSHASRKGMPRMGGDTRLRKNGPTSMARNGRTASHLTARIDQPSEVGGANLALLTGRALITLYRSTEVDARFAIVSRTILSP
jgi:hypothetical protein